jgi:hypothetical protein
MPEMLSKSAEMPVLSLVQASGKVARLCFVAQPWLCYNGAARKFTQPVIWLSGASSQRGGVNGRDD